MKSKRPALNYILLILLFLNPPFCLNAQFVNLPVLNKGSIDSQFVSLQKYSYLYEYNGIPYKSIKVDHFNTLRKNVNDTLKNFYKDFQKFKVTLAEKDSIIDSLRRELGNTSEKYMSTRKEKNSLNFLGITFNKLAYSGILWTIILGLAFVLVLLALLYKRNNMVTTQTKQDLEDLKKEFETHRKRALEREEKLARQHLDELNKYKK